MDTNSPNAPVPRERLQRHLEQLRAELGSAGELDVETRALLEEVAVDIEQALHEDTFQPSTFAERLEASALEFEADHPALARVLREVTDALAKLGV
jgi:hypothetical protein